MIFFLNGASPHFFPHVRSGDKDFSKTEVLVPAIKTTLLLLKNKQGL